MVSRVERAKQFLPFDALKGLQEALREREEQLEYVEKVELSDEVIECLSEKLKMIEIGNSIKVKYYYNKLYKEVIGKVKKIDKVNKKIELEADVEIKFNNILNIEET